MPLASICPVTPSRAIKKVILQLVIDQQQYLQGYFGVLQICLTKKYGFAGLQIDTRGGLC